MSAYRTPAKQPEEPEKAWWEDEKPTEKERELWVQFYIAIIQSSRAWTIDGNTSAAENADAAIVSHRKRFGVVK
jgi:hypothetical protein